MLGQQVLVYALTYKSVKSYEHTFVSYGPHREAPVFLTLGLFHVQCQKA